MCFPDFVGFTKPTNTDRPLFLHPHSFTYKGLIIEAKDLSVLQIAGSWTRISHAGDGAKEHRIVRGSSTPKETYYRGKRDLQSSSTLRLARRWGGVCGLPK
jgi:hypothetical protein